VIGVTESRVSQIHSGLRKKLRERLHGYDDALALMDA
jgi:DNA-directed RNA polymerase specialized sigma subunit